MDQDPLRSPSTAPVDHEAEELSRFSAAEVEWALRRLELTKHFTVIEATVLGLSVGLASSTGAHLGLDLKLSLVALLLSLVFGCLRLGGESLQWYELDAFIRWLRAKQERERVNAVTEDASGVSAFARLLPRIIEVVTFRIGGDVEQPFTPPTPEEVEEFVRETGIHRSQVTPRSRFFVLFLSDRVQGPLSIGFLVAGIAAAVLMVVSVVRR